MTEPAPIAVALDGPNLETILGWAAQTGPHVSTMKIGLETYLRDGDSAVHGVREAAQGRDIFLDLKLHDIPNTVAGAARSIAHLAPAYLTVHASGGSDMIRAAAQELPDTAITAVTILTSLDQAQLSAIGISGTPLDAVRRLAELAVTAGARAIVCSPQEVSAVRAVVPEHIVLVTPGVRPVGADQGDQARVATPQQALADGADLLVIGRPITGALDPAQAAQDLCASLNS
jgi:orotidine-5'-phosphate decarboxylase